MEISKKLEKLGIVPKKKLEIEEKRNLTQIVSDNLTLNINELPYNYNEIYMRIFNCDMYYATIKEGFGGVFYYYKNNSIYIDENKDILIPDEYIIHEIIHCIQNFDKINEKTKRAGLCNFTEFKLIGLGINEAIVQYISAKAIGNKIDKVKNDSIELWTNSKRYYKYMTSLANQILLLVGEKEAIKSCICSTEDFENKLYNTFEENTDKILRGFNNILELNGRIDRREDKIINEYMKIQRIIYRTYFSKIYNHINTLEEITTEIDKLQRYEEIVGRLLEDSNKESEFENFKRNMEEKFTDKYLKISRKQSKTSLVIYKNSIINLLNKILHLAQSKLKRIK